MPRYLYRCPSGHTTERERLSGERNLPIDCPACGADAEREPMLEVRTQRLALRPEFCEHFNVSLGRTVSSRKHLAEIQQKHGYEDAHVKHEPPTDWE